MDKKWLELYIHIPFCEQKCLYCDFLSFRAPVKAYQEYIGQLITEIRAQGECFLDHSVSSVFIGGGTPSILSSELIVQLFAALRESFRLMDDAEITIEANPGTLRPERLNAYRECGINRLSLGLQSANDQELKILGRIHSFDDFLKSYQAARVAGFQNINVDLMSVLPGQSVQSWKDTLRKVLRLRPEHISAYSLMIEEGTPFYDHYHAPKRGSAIQSPSDKGTSPNRQRYGAWPPLPGEEADREMYHVTKEMLADKGYMRYEISNYARSGCECRHNIGYWTGVDYLGLGLGASSCVLGFRYKNVTDFQEYMSLDLTVPGNAAREIEELSEKDRMAEFMFLGLRLSEGVSGNEFFRRFGKNMWNVYADVLPGLKAKGLIEAVPPFVRLTELGMDVSNQVFCEFV